MGHFRRFLPDVCQLCSRHIGKFVHASEREIIFWPNCSKFAKECDWNKTLEIWVFFEKIDGFFEKKLKYYQSP